MVSDNLFIYVNKKKKQDNHNNIVCWINYLEYHLNNEHH